MPSALILYTETLQRWIAPRNETYRLLTGEPRRVGDEALIEITTGFKTQRHRVMLCEVRTTLKPTRWLVALD